MTPGAALGGILALGLFGGAVILGPHAAHAADATPNGGDNLSVTVTDDEPTDSPSPSATDGTSVGATDAGTTDAGSSETVGGGTTTESGGGSTGAGPAGAAPATEEVSVGGMLYVGGLNSMAVPTRDPRDGLVRLWFTVRNASKSTVDASVRFWIDGAVFGNRLDEADDVPVHALQPGETRVATVVLRHVGQWTFLNAHATFTPPKTVDGTALKPITRDASVALFPWLLAIIAVAGGASIGIASAILTSRASAPAPTAPGPVVTS